MQRFLDMTYSEIAALSGRELLQSFRLSEGRVLFSEIVAHKAPLVDGISNAELAAAMGADCILLNMIDPGKPQIAGIAGMEESVFFFELASFLGRPVGINLEPSDLVNPGYRATPEQARRAVDRGVSFILLTGNPASGVTLDDIARSLEEIRKTLGDDPVLMAGKMHHAGVLPSEKEPFLSDKCIRSWKDAGADVILFPAPGTVPGITMENAVSFASEAHSSGLLAMTSIGTSQEGGSAESLAQIALWSKMCGVDLHHIGDAGYSGIAVPENITAYSVALRGRRHTWRRMGASIRR
ncbi:MAG TPA: hypothetical protein PK364_11890 [Synergistaceae bacterium]|nr:hypothetical protein [Synergistaceae bacterium]HPJ24751.1 hypothetical protein [Synergistaceae bacterium]